ncbi:MAG: protein translocase subunit SecD [Proteobacteria bacterium]|nr:protein translocase subunit SecD [Pseudomonadota bacterium]NCA28106.1 protein translocase subunit SecD [Pseudomonadota bacterium]
MLVFSKTKIFLISIICVLALYFALPTFFLNSSLNNEKIIKLLPSNKVNLGLDLQGGSQLLLEIDINSYLDDQLLILKDEIKNIFYEDSVRSLVEKVDNKIIFTVANEEEKALAKKLVQKISKQLEITEESGQFEIFFSDYEIEKMKKNLINQSIEIIRRRVDENGTKEPTIVSQGDKRILLQVPGVQNSQELKNSLGKTAKMTFHLPANDSDQQISVTNVIQLFDAFGNQYSLNKDAVLSGDLLVDASATYHDGKPAVAFRFNALGSRKFAEITQNNIGKIFAIVLDGKVITAPMINTVINQGSGVITGSFTVAEASQLSLLLRAGALPAPLQVVEERSVGPSLGSDSIASGKIASLVSLFLVAFFMILFYGFFGSVANIALIINISIIISLLSLLSATLTLPGIAGIVLTMGMSVDANVLIFERIKEELKNNKSVLFAIEQGFGQAYRTILDSNITTLIVAFFLYVFGNGSIKGFAVTLSIGIISSMFTAILLTRMLISLWLKRTRPKKLSLT